MWKALQLLASPASRGVDCHENEGDSGCDFSTHIFYFLGLVPFALADAPGTPFEVGGHVYPDATLVSGAAGTVTN